MLVGLLRGVNVGGRNRVSMSALRSALAEAGLDRVSTYLQSGNVIADHPDPAAFRQVVESVLSDGFGLDVTVIVRSGTDLAGVLAWNPFPHAAASAPKLVHVWFLEQQPEDSMVAALEANTGRDEWTIEGRDLVVRYEDGSQGSRLARKLAKTFDPNVTARNWSTVEAIAKLASAPVT